MRSLALRIGVTGSAGTGKTSLVGALAKELDLPQIGEEVREYFRSNSTKTEPLDADVIRDWDRQKLRQLFEALWAKRKHRELELESFVADNTALDFLSYALFHGLYDDSRASEATPLLIDPTRIVASYDAVFVLPCGVIPYERDGVRSDSEFAELRHQYLVENALRRFVAPQRVHYIPRECASLPDRVDFVRQCLEGAGLLENSAMESTEDDSNCGKVYLVGAGPGHPELLTVRALQLIREADIVAHDRLVPAELLAEVPEHVELLPVGHRGRGARHVGYRLHPEVMAAAKSGKRVVRLKAGDPLIFGRGGEEAEELHEEGIPFEIVPGVSAAVGAAAYSGIPLTHREHASDVTFATGHIGSSKRPTLTNWDSLGDLRGTLALYMAAQRLEGNLARLIAAGRSANTPAAYIAAATQVDQRVIVGTLENLAELTCDEDRTIPGLVVIGEVVNARSSVDWLSIQRPLFGKRVLVARARSGASNIARCLRQLGAYVVEWPNITVESEVDHAGLRGAMRDQMDGIVFTGASAAKFFYPASVDSGVSSIRGEPKPLTIALNSSVRLELQKSGRDPDFTARGACREALSEAVAQLWGRATGQRLLIPCDQRKGPSLERDLKDIGVHPRMVQVYRTSTSSRRFGVGTFDLAVYPSSSSVQHAFKGALSSRLREVPAISIGPTTSKALSDAGARWVHQCSNDKVSTLVDESCLALGVGKFCAEAVS